MQKKENIILALISIVLGFMLIILKGDVIGLAITVIGVAVLIDAIIDFASKLLNIGIIKAVVGICILVFGWMFVNLALYILAASIIVKGLLQIVNIHKFSPVNLTLKDTALIYLKPVITVIAGACLFFNQDGAIAWIFVVTGALLIVEGVLELISLAKSGF